MDIAGDRFEHVSASGKRDGDAMREWGGESDRVHAGGICPVLAGEVCRAESVRCMVVGLTLAWLIAGLVGASGTAQATEACPNEASRQGPSVNLPECRAYEQVTPVDKGDAVDIFGSSFQETGIVGLNESAGNDAYVAEDGGAILVHTDGSFAPQAPPSEVAYVFSRGSKGWRMTPLTQSIDEPQEDPGGAMLFDPRDLSEVGFSDGVGTFSELLGGDESAFQEAELAGPVGGPYAPLHSLSGFAVLDEEEQVEMAGGSEDLSRVVLQGENHSLAAGAEEQDPKTDALYERTGSGECGPTTCKLVDVNSEGKAMPCGATLGQGELAAGGAHSAVSSDGSRIFFTAPEPEKSGVGCWNPNSLPQQENPPELYMREGGTRTVTISAPEAGVEVGTPENPLLPAVFVGASSDGSKVFFMTRMRLTQGAVGEAPEVYEYNTEPPKGQKALTLISGGQSETLEGDVDSVTAVSSDGAAVYFSAYAKLATGASQYPPGKEDISPANLYRYDTTTGETTYITTLNKFDYPVAHHAGDRWYTNEFGGNGTEDEGLMNNKEWYTTGDGQFLVFGTVLPLTGFDNNAAPGVTCENSFPGAANPKGCLELYRYDAATGQIVCVSCAGGAPVDGAYFDRIYYDSPAGGPNRPISEDGQDVFFESANAIVPQAVPGRDHVYEWHQGVISLISSPSDPDNALFLGSSENGANVFFVTHAQLAPSDTDQAADIYDARVEGGFAGITPSQCTDTGCQGVPSAPPIFETPASATFEGVGNFPASQPAAAVKPKARKPAKCKRDFVKKRNRCVKQKKTKKAKKSTGSSRGGKK